MKFYFWLAFWLVAVNVPWMPGWACWIAGGLAVVVGINEVLNWEIG